MERTTKRIVAIALIAIIAVAAGVGVWVYFTFFGTESRWVTPGVSGVSSDRWIRVGCLGDTGEIQGDGNWEGAWLAAYEINTNGGVEVNNETYYVALISEDTDEANPQLDVTRGVAAADKIINVDNARYLVGGFRTEALKSYLEVAMDNKKLFFGTGAATDYFCEQVLNSYNRYKYFFRTMPINSTSLGRETIYFLLTLGPVLNASYGQEIRNVAIIREDLDWTEPMYSALVDNLEDNSVWNYTIVRDEAYPIDATSDHFDGVWNRIEDAGARIAVPIISAQGGIYMMKKYAAKQPECLVAGIDVQSQSSEYWSQTAGDCAFETIMQPLTNTSKTTTSIDYWNAFDDKWGHAPLYTATGAYDAVNFLVHAINDSQSFDELTLIKQLEDYNTSAGYYAPSATSCIEGMSPTAPYAGFYIHPNGQPTHDVIEGWPYGTTQFAQWQNDTQKYCVPAPLVYPSGMPSIRDWDWAAPYNVSIVESNFQIPDWFGW